RRRVERLRRARQRLGRLHPRHPPRGPPGHPWRRRPNRRGGRVVKDPRDVIIEPIVSEKSYALSEAGLYTFRVHKSATKPEIHDAVEKIFNVKVTKRSEERRVGQDGR